MSVASRNFGSPIVTPLLIHPLHRTMNRYREVEKAFSRIISGRHVSANKSSVALVSFESPENIIFVTDSSEDVPDINEMMSWELLLRTGAPVKDYNISSSPASLNKRLVAASTKKDIAFYTKQIERLGIKTIAIEPPIVSAVNLFDFNYDVSGEALVAISGHHKITLAYINDGDLIDIAQYTARLSELVSSEDIMKIRAEISARNSIGKDVPMYLTGDLLADKEYADFLSNDLINCSYIDPFKCVDVHEKTNKDLMEKYSLVFGVAVSLSNKTV
jgi:hypothetical protein